LHLVSRLTPVQIHVAVAKVAKFGFSVSGDTLEMIERPHGGLSFVLADGQGHGPAAKVLSHLVVAKAVALLADGVRDGAAARATHDFLYAYRQGKVSADLTIVSVDLVSKTIVLSRNSQSPLLVLDKEELRLVGDPSQPIGIYVWTKPAVVEIPLAENLVVVVISDGVLEAGERYGQRMDLLATARSLLGPPPVAQTIADGLLARAVALDHGRPEDDTSVLVLTTLPDAGEDPVRRLHVSFPLET
jgi:serine phosphatase RsbU (regulator of sigma subunit)